MAIKKRDGIRVKGINSLKNSLSELGIKPRQQRTQINKALRPAGNILARAMQRGYKREFNSNSDYKRKSGRTPTYKTIGIFTARKSREPGIFVGPLKRRTTPIRVKGKDSYNLTEMQILGNKIQKPRKDIFLEAANKVNLRVLNQAEKDLGKLLDKMIKQSGFR